MALRDILIETIQYNQQSYANTFINLVQNGLLFGGADASILNGVYDLVVPTAMIATVAYWLEGYVELTADGREVSKDKIIQSFIWLLVGWTFMVCVRFIASTALGGSNVLCETFADMIKNIPKKEAADAAQTAADAAQNAVNTNGAANTALETMNILGLVGCLAVSFLSWFVTQLAKIVMYISVIGVRIEILLRVALLPIGLCSMSSPTYKNDAIRYFKKTLASFFYGAVIMLAVYIAMTAQSSIMKDASDTVNATGQNGLIAAGAGLSNALTQLVAPFAAIGAVSSAKSIANEAFGS